MSTREIVVPFKRGTTSQNDNYKGVPGEVTIDVTKTTLRVHDGITIGGNEMLTRTMADQVTEDTAAAAASAASALASKNAAASSATAAEGSKNAAAASAAAALESKNSAAGSAATATERATAATDRAAVAMDAATTAVAARAAVVSALDSFRSVYLGEFATDPTADSNGNPILDGAEYRNTTTNKIRVYRTTDHTWRDYTADEQAALLNAQLSAANAANSAGAALTSEQHAAQSEIAAETAESSATASAASALASKNAASTSAQNAATSETNAAGSELDAQASKNAAAVSEQNAASSEANALASKNAAALSKDSAAQMAVSASDSSELAQAWAATPEDQVVETGLYSSLHYAAKSKEQADRAQAVADATESANVDAVSVHNDRLHVDQVMPTIQSNADSALASKNAAKISEDNAKASETAAASSAAAAATDADTASSAATTAEQRASEAATSKSDAAQSAAQALASKNAAQISASNAAGSEANAGDSEDAAWAAKISAENAAVSSEANLVAFRNRWYGSASADPTVRPDGSGPQVGDVYWNSGSSTFKVYIGGAGPTLWINPVSDASLIPASPATNFNATTVQGFLNQLASKWNGITKATVGLGNVDNTADLSKPISTATQTALNAKQNSIPYQVVQQGTGVNQTANVVKIGWSSQGRLKATVDSTDMGNFAMEATANTFSPLQAFAGGSVSTGGSFQPNSTAWTFAALRVLGSFGGGVSFGDSGTSGNTSGAIMYVQGAELRMNAVNANSVGNGLKVGFNYLSPIEDRGQYLGLSTNRWENIYSYTSAITTSDARWKTVVRSLEEAEFAWAKALGKEIGIYQMLAEVSSKGENVARLHCGMTVQRAIELGQQLGLDPMRYAFICHDVWEDEFEDVPEVPATETVLIPFKEVQIINGAPVLVEGNREEQRLVKQEVQVIDAEGHPVYDKVPAELDEEGNQISPAREVPMMHQVQVVAQPAFRRKVRDAGDIYSFRTDQLALFILRGLAPHFDAA